MSNENEGKSLGRLISNLESDPDIQARRNKKPENAREGGLRMLRERVARLSKFLQPLKRPPMRRQWSSPVRLS